MSLLLGPTQYIFHMLLARCSLFVLKVRLNTDQPTSLTDYCI